VNVALGVSVHVSVGIPVWVGVAERGMRVGTNAPCSVAVGLGWAAGAQAPIPLMIASAIRSAVIRCIALRIVISRNGAASKR
jgi:hypothetical protein